MRRAGLNVPPQNAMFCDSWVSLTAPIMEYEDFPLHQCPAAMERVRAVYSRLGYLLGCLFPPACVCPAPQSHNHSLDSGQRAGFLSSLSHFVLRSQILFPPPAIPTEKSHRKPLASGFFCCARLRSCTVGPVHVNLPSTRTERACFYSDSIATGADFKSGSQHRNT